MRGAVRQDQVARVPERQPLEPHVLRPLGVDQALGPAPVEDHRAVAGRAVHDGPPGRAAAVDREAARVGARVQQEQVAGLGGGLGRGEAAERIGRGAGAAACRLARGHVTHPHVGGRARLPARAHDELSFRVAAVGVGEGEAHLVLGVRDQVHDAAGEEPAVGHAVVGRHARGVRAEERPGLAPPRLARLPVLDADRGIRVGVAADRPAHGQRVEGGGLGLHLGGFRRRRACRRPARLRARVRARGHRGRRRGLARRLRGIGVGLARFCARRGLGGRRRLAARGRRRVGGAPEARHLAARAEDAKLGVARQARQGDEQRDGCARQTALRHRTATIMGHASDLPWEQRVSRSAPAALAPVHRSRYDRAGTNEPEDPATLIARTDSREDP